MKKKKKNLSKEEIEKYLAKSLFGWIWKDEKYLEKTFRFKNYKEVNIFLPYIGTYIAKLNHHPDFSFDAVNKSVYVKIYTHDTSGVSEHDINLAKTLQRWREGCHAGDSP